MNHSVLKEKEALLKEWKQQPQVATMEIEDPERFERSRQFVLYMKEFEMLLAKKVKARKKEVSLLDLEFLVCIHNLFLCLSS